MIEKVSISYDDKAGKMIVKSNVDYPNISANLITAAYQVTRNLGINDVNTKFALMKAVSMLHDDGTEFSIKKGDTAK